MTTESTELASAVESRTEIDLDALIAALDAGWDVLPEEALRTCQAHRELVTPRLIGVLEEAVGLGREAEFREGNAPLFALFLLAEFESKEALPVVLDFFRLPEFVLDELLGDTLTQDGARLLAVLAGHDPAPIELLVVDKEASAYSRWEAAAALRQLVVDGRLSREDALARLAEQMRRCVAAEDQWGVTITIDGLSFLNPLEVQDEIKSAFHQELVDESIIDWQYFKERCLHPDQPGCCPLLDRFEPSAVADTVEEMRNWNCFSDQFRRDQETYAARRAEYERKQAEHEADWESRPSITVRNESPRIGRNDPCPCGSGKKYKKCCLRSVADE